MNRRSLLLGASATTALMLAPVARAATLDQARGLVDLLVRDVNAVIASGKAEAAMLRDFETIFSRYADVPTIARYTLGNEARRATPAQMQQFTAAFRTYIARKYGRRFREFIGGQIEVRDARNVPNGVEVETMAILRGQTPFRVDFQVSDRSGQVLFFNIIIEGINMLLSERTEMLALLDQRRGDIDRLIAELPQS
ncbi:MAG: ABC transporter substrate-binding protein [Rhodobacterales bacterium]|nr:ABC transporter substrate-binding protein [Rhodobacterales bacterium]NCT11275.1 ABC transporter substrate-binding protein [Rhodobacterales bacterium]